VLRRVIDFALALLLWRRSARRPAILVARRDEAPRNDRDDEPFKKPSGQPLDFRGPGREEQEPDVD
jgi:hypothetical protein